MWWGCLRKDRKGRKEGKRKSRLRVISERERWRINRKSQTKRDEKGGGGVRREKETLQTDLLPSLSQSKIQTVHSEWRETGKEEEQGTRGESESHIEGERAVSSFNRWLFDGAST